MHPLILDVRRIVEFPDGTVVAWVPGIPLGEATLAACGASKETTWVGGILAVETRRVLLLSSLESAPHALREKGWSNGGKAGEESLTFRNWKNRIRV